MFKLTISTIAILLCSPCSATFPVDPRIETSVWEEEDRVTALYLISSKGDYIGAGVTKSYVEGQDGKFVISTNPQGAVTIRLTESKEYWTLIFSATGNQNLTPGIYKNATRYPFNRGESPGLCFSGNGRGCNTLTGEFEILEIEYDAEGKVNIFAANFIQNCGVNGTPLFGSIRINSEIPIEDRFSEIFDNFPETFLNLRWLDFKTITAQTFFLTADSSKFSIKNLPYGGEGIEVIIENEDGGLWVLDFAAPFGEQFGQRVYPDAYRYPFHNSFFAGIDILTPQGGFTQPDGQFEVLKLTRGEQGEITSLALDFAVTNENEEAIEGAIRYNSKIPFDSEIPSEIPFIIYPGMQ